MNFLQVTDIRRQEGAREVLQGISFVQAEGDRLAIVGASGSGKSTLLRVIAGHSQPAGGEVRFQGRRVRGPEERLIMGHPGIAYLSQHFELRNNYRVEEILSYANLLSDEDAQNIFEICRIDGLLKRRTDQVSGGERQRIALARLMVGSPKLLLLDEPYSNLDLIHKETLRNVVEEICAKLGTTCLMVSHDPRDILSWADRILVMRDGQVITQDTPASLYSRPVDEYTAALFGKYNIVEKEMAIQLCGGEIFKHIGKSVFIRPEQLRLQDDAEPGGVEGEVLRVCYQGSHYEVEVRLGSGQVTVNAAHNGIPVGARVRVSMVRQPL